MEMLDDDILLLALGLLSAGDVLGFGAASASLAGRLAGTGDCDGRGGGGAAERLAVAELGRAAAVAAVAAVGNCTNGGERPTSGPWAALRALASSAPAGEALRHAVLLTRSAKVCSSRSTAGLSPLVGSGSLAPVADARIFFDMLFKAEVRRKTRGPGTATLAAADAALTTLLVASDGGCGVMLVSAEVMQEAERDLDNLVDEGRAEGFHAAYEVVARRRSAVEFLRRRLESTVAGGWKPWDTSASTKAKHVLDLAIAELDETIVSYTREGYDLACPRLANVIAQCSVPYTHWWIFLGRPYSEGWAVLR